jgi:glycosyltransferase involved in cell wall biosynthesis
VRLVLIGDGESPHLLKWARALKPHVDLWVISSRGFLPAFQTVLPADHMLALKTQSRIEGLNARLLLKLPKVATWLAAISPDWLHAHHLTSHGTLAWLSRFIGVRGRLCGSAWGSDILMAPRQSPTLAWLTRRVLKACSLCTSDSAAMAERMRQWGAREVLVFPFGLEVVPPEPTDKDNALFFSNCSLEAASEPMRVLQSFARIAADWPAARLVMAEDGSLRSAVEQRVKALGLAERVHFTGRLDAATQSQWYGAARWYYSLPSSDSASVCLLEAMGHGCIPVVSDLPANRELVHHGRNGWIYSDEQPLTHTVVQSLLPRLDSMGRRNRDWVLRHAMFGPAVERFVARLYGFDAEFQSTQ